MIMHFNSTKERLAFIRGEFTEIKPKEVKNVNKAPKEDAKKDNPDFDAMTKTELIEYALANGIQIKVKDTKANILSAIKGGKVNEI